MKFRRTRYDLGTLLKDIWKKPKEEGKGLLAKLFGEPFSVIDYELSSTNVFVPVHLMIDGKQMAEAVIDPVENYVSVKSKYMRKFSHLEKIMFHGYNLVFDESGTVNKPVTEVRYKGAINEAQQVFRKISSFDNETAVTHVTR